jgi:hypothetical protein
MRCLAESVDRTSRQSGRNVPSVNFAGQAACVRSEPLPGFVRVISSRLPHAVSSMRRDASMRSFAAVGLKRTALDAE